MRELNSYLRDIDDIFDGGARFEANEQRLAKQLASQQAALRSRSQQAQNELASQLSDLHAAHRQAQERASSLGVSGVPNQDANPTGPDFAGLHELLDRLEAAQRAVRLSDRMSKAKTFDWITLAAGIAITLVASYFSLKLGSVVFLLPLLVVGLMVASGKGAFIQGKAIKYAGRGQTYEGGLGCVMTFVVIIGSAFILGLLSDFMSRRMAVSGASRALLEIATLVPLTLWIVLAVVLLANLILRPLTGRSPMFDRFTGYGFVYGGLAQTISFALLIAVVTYAAATDNAQLIQALDLAEKLSSQGLSASLLIGLTGPGFLVLGLLRRKGGLAELS